MADVKTNLRELSILVGIYSIDNNSDFPMDSESFYNCLLLINEEL